jgi:hypothetical protein
MVGDDIVLPRGPDVQALIVVILDVGTAHLRGLMA